ncbi:hypothetical protein ACVOMS_25015 [Bradyrhizobium guangxiense]
MAAARDGGQPWFVLGDLFAKALATAADADLVALRTAASEAARLSPGVLRRYVVLLDRLRTIAETHGLARDETRFPGVQRGGGRGEDLRTRCRAGDDGPGGPQGRGRHLGRTPPTACRTSPPVELQPVDTEPKEERRTAKSAARGLAVVRSREPQSRLHAQGARALGRGTLGSRKLAPPAPPTRHYTSHQGFEIVGAGAPDRPRAGGELFILDGREESELGYFERVFPSYLVLATFYPAFFFAFSPSTPDASVTRAVELPGLFGAGSIGVVRVTAAGTVETLLEPDGPPVPDRIGRFDVLGT